MIKIIAGGRKNKGWIQEACEDYEKRLKKPFNIEWDFMTQVDFVSDDVFKKMGFLVIAVKNTISNNILTYNLSCLISVHMP